jgi:hypothetical protein
MDVEGTVTGSLKTTTTIVLLPAYLAYPLAPKLDTARSSATLVNLYHYAGCHIPSTQKYSSNIYCNFRSTLETLMNSGKNFLVPISFYKLRFFFFILNFPIYNLLNKSNK